MTIKSKKESLIVSKDEFPKFGTTAEKLAKLRPAFRPVSKIVVFIGHFNFSEFNKLEIVIFYRTTVLSLLATHPA